jgi:hypothetical protein
MIPSVSIATTTQLDPGMAKAKQLPPGTSTSLKFCLINHFNSSKGVEESRDRKHVRCIICKENDALGEGKWILKSSLTGHMSSGDHLTAVARKEERAERRVAQEAIRQRAYTTAPIQPSVYFTNPSLPTSHSMFDTSHDNHDPQEDINMVSNDFPAFALPIIQAYISPIIHSPEAERERLCQQVEDLLQQAEHEDEFGGGDSDDIMMTNVMDEFRSLHQWLPLVIINFRQVPAQAFICSPVTYEMKFKPISFLPKDRFHCLPSAMF